MKVLKLAFMLTVSSVCSWAQADTLGLTADLSYWLYDAKVEAKQPLSDNQSLERDGSLQASLAFEHPVPFLPNVKVKSTNLKSESANNNTALSGASVDVRHTDYILYYEVLDNVISVDLGFGLANLAGDIKVKQPLSNVHYSISGNKPIVYASVAGKLPFTQWSAKGEAVYSNIDDEKLTDLQAEVQYNFVQNLAVDVGAKLGYRYTQVNLEKDKNQDISFQFKGPYLGLNMHF